MKKEDPTGQNEYWKQQFSLFYEDYMVMGQTEQTLQSQVIDNMAQHIKIKVKATDDRRNIVYATALFYQLAKKIPTVGGAA